MPRKVSELENGDVIVRVRSRRGTGTRDQDEVTIDAVFDDLEHAENQSERVNQLVKERMTDARAVGTAEEPDSTNQDGPEVSKVYLGDGSPLRGWIPLPRQVVVEEITPLVSENLVGNDDLPGIKVNFSKDIPHSGWKEVDADVVSGEIEPLVRRHRLTDEAEWSSSNN